MRRDLAFYAGRGETHARAGMLENVTEFGAVQLGIGGHRGEPRVPDAVDQFEICGRVLGDDGDAVAGRESESLAQRAREPRCARGQARRNVAVNARAERRRRAAIG